MTEQEILDRLKSLEFSKKSLEASLERLRATKAPYKFVYMNNTRELTRGDIIITSTVRVEKNTDSQLVGVLPNGERKIICATGLLWVLTPEDCNG